MKYLLAFMILTIVTLSYAGSFRISESKPVSITAGRSTYKWDLKKLILENSNNVLPTITYENSYLKSDTILYDDVLKKGFAYGNVYYEDRKENIIIRAEEAVYDEIKKEITLTKNPRIILKKDGTIARGNRIKIYPERDEIFLLGDVKISNTNMLITGEVAEVNQTTKKFLIKNDVVVSQKDSKLFANRLYLDTKNRNSESYTATGNVRIEDEKEGYSIYGDRIDYFKEEGYTRITGGYSNSTKPYIEFKEKNAFASSIVMEKFDKEDKANLLGDVLIIQGSKKASAMWGEYFIKRKKIVLTGNPILEENESKFQSYKINVDIEKETMNMIGRGKGEYKLKN